jgi:DsbC/DsbD-like thiol-disulfide interchange protein
MIPLLLLALVFGGGQRPSDIVRWTVTSTSVSAGGTAKFAVTARIQDGWKLYAIEQPADGPVPLEIKLQNGSRFELLRKQIAGPAPRILKDPNFDVETRYYEKEAAFTVPVKVPPAAAGAHEVPFEITFQACGADICLRPFTQKLSASLEVRR